MKNRIWLTAALLSGLLVPALAQRNPEAPRSAEPNAYNLMRESTYNRYVTFNASLRYGVGVPLGTQRNYINQLSPANALVTMEWQFPQNFSLGLQSGYQYSQQRLPRAVYSFPETGEDISAVQTRTLTVTPVLASAAYYFSDPAAPIRPYVQLAGGGAFINYTNFYGTLADQDKQFAGMIAPAIGVKIFGKREKGLGGEIQAQYQNAFYKYNELNNPSNLMLSAGLTYRFY
ncbi:hypothetical protein ACAW74_01640 [Fibrella sp. WM1]|uniref:hypothetical protein n=1 Tax=Fibrella musci TaxID=3242485 RepID=UPI0035209526